MIIYTEVDFEIRPSTIKGAGMGLFSRVDIELEETIGYYTGEVITETQWYEESKLAGSNYWKSLGMNSAEINLCFLKS